MQETNLFLQMIEKCMQKLSKEAEGKKKNGYRVTGIYCLASSTSSFELTYSKFYRRKNKSRTIGLDIEQIFRKR